MNFVNNPVAVAGGFGYSCALVANGTLVNGGSARCWGDNGSGQLGDGSTTASLIRVVVKTLKQVGTFVIATPHLSAVGITTGRRHSCTLRANGDVACWGENTVGQLGIGSIENQVSPVTVSNFSFIPGPPPDNDGDAFADEVDNCPGFANPTQGDVDNNGRGDLCECGDQNGDGRVNVTDLIAINAAIFDPLLVTALCDANNDGLCNVSDIVGANRTIFTPKSSICARQPVPGP